MADDPTQALAATRFRAPAVGYALMQFLGGMFGYDELRKAMGDRNEQDFARQLGLAALAAVAATDFY